MASVESFLSSAEENEIISAIRTAESLTSGEIRVHIEQNCNSDVMEHALEVFYQLKMDNTKDANGVLIYVAVNQHAFVIYGDKGINDKVGVDFWNSTRDKIQEKFKNGNYSQGLIDGILECGKVLSIYFPWSPNDNDELDNSISKN